MNVFELFPFLPSNCPVCNTILKFDGIHLYCQNSQCKGKIARKLGYAASILDLKGIAGKTLEPFADTFENMYDLFMWVIQNKDNLDTSQFGIKNNSRSQKIFIDAFVNIKSLTYSQVILMLGFDDIGTKLSEQVARDYCGLEPNYKGHEKAIVDIFKNEDIRNYIQGVIVHLESHGVKVDKPKDIVDTKSINVCMSGSPKNFGFKTKEDFMKNFNNVNEVSITSELCEYLIVDDVNSNSNKTVTAKKRGIKIVTYSEFLNIHLKNKIQNSIN